MRSFLGSRGLEVLVGVLVVGCVVDAALNDSLHASPSVTVPFALLCSLPLFLRRRFPLGFAAVIAVAFVVETFIADRAVGASSTSLIVLMWAIAAVAVHNERRTALAVGLVFLLLPLLVIANDPTGRYLDYIGIAVLAALSWTGGAVWRWRTTQNAELRERAVRAERERDERARAAVAEERARIARELHDVVAHSVSVMTVQAGAVRRLLLADQAREREALEAVESTGREALAELRRMLGVMRSDSEAAALAPQPGLEHLGKLVATVREAGLPVELRVEGEAAALPAGVDLSAYRVVQEGLTNALKHAGGARAEVVVRYQPDAVEIEVLDDGVGGPANGDGGHGLIGMRERVALYGGDLESGPRPGGGYRLRVRLPVSS